MTTINLTIEDTKLDIINWVKRLHDEHLILKLDQLRTEQLGFDDTLTEEQKIAIVEAINTLEEGQ